MSFTKRGLGLAISERRKRETETLRQKVLDIAEEIFVQEGLEKVTMRRLAAAVDYAPTVLYRLFTNKDELMDHLIVRGYEGVRSRYDEVLAQDQDNPLETLKQLLNAYVDYALNHPNHYRMWFETSTLHRDQDRLRLDHGRLEYVVFQAWIKRIEDCMDAGLLPKQAPLQTFQILWARVHGLISLRLQHPDFPWLPVPKHLAGVLDLP